jgi:hypothetical protein
MTITGSIYFLGRYRPAYFEAESPMECAVKMLCASRNVADTRLRFWLAGRIKEGHVKLDHGAISSWSADHNDRGVSFAKRPHDSWLDKTTATMEPCPGLDYSGAVNQ